MTMFPKTTSQISCSQFFKNDVEICPGDIQATKTVLLWLFKVIPLKLFYYQTFFETWRNEHSLCEHYKNAIKKWGHRACLRVSRLLK